jgi:hypothetical protein
LNIRATANLDFSRGLARAGLSRFWSACELDFGTWV